MKKVSTILFVAFAVVFAWGQEAKFTVAISVDSLLLGNPTQVTFSLENAQGSNFSPPDFVGFDMVGGPSQSSSFSMINGKVTQSQSFTYYLEPQDVGNYYIQAASIETGEGILETEPVPILVVPNPDGVKQKPKAKSQGPEFLEPKTPQQTPTKKSRKKRRIYRI